VFLFHGISRDWADTQNGESLADAQVLAYVAARDRLESVVNLAVAVPLMKESGPGSWSELLRIEQREEVARALGEFIVRDEPDGPLAVQAGRRLQAL
jgi:hypothetical protein